MSVCSVSLENVVMQSGKRWKEKVEDLKEKGNKAYKNNEYLNALYFY